MYFDFFKIHFLILKIMSLDMKKPFYIISEYQTCRDAQADQHLLFAA